MTQKPQTQAPARIKSFSQEIQTLSGSSLTLECVTVGNPQPFAKWFTNDDRAITFSPYYEISSKGHLKIDNVQTKLAGNYTCISKNFYGEDKISYLVTVLKAPNISILPTYVSTYNTIRILWKLMDSGGTQIQQIHIFYRTVNDDWTKIALLPKDLAYTLNGLFCGHQYFVKIVAYNYAGLSSETDEMSIWTKGKGG